MAKQYGMEAEDLKKYIEAEVIQEQVLRSKAIAVVVDSAVAVKPEERREARGEAQGRGRRRTPPPRRAPAESARVSSAYPGTKPSGMRLYCCGV